jgi:hypothetical protein
MQATHFSQNIENKLIQDFILNYWLKEKVEYHCGQTIFFVTIE